jgi:hypothetical protein
MCCIEITVVVVLLYHPASLFTNIVTNKQVKVAVRFVKSLQMLHLCVVVCCVSNLHLLCHHLFILPSILLFAALFVVLVSVSVFRAYTPVCMCVCVCCK